MSPLRVAILLYEDSRTGGPAKDFGPHSLVVACVADVLGVTVHSVFPRLQCVPKRGNVQVMRAIREDMDDLAVGGRRVVAVLDADQAPSLVDLPRSVSTQEVVDAVKAMCGAHACLDVALIDRNWETVVKEIMALRPDRFTPETFDRAVRHRPGERDLVLNSAAYGASSLRNDLRARMPSVEALVQHLASLVASAG